METLNKHQKTKEENISNRINSTSWALFFIMIGCLWLVPAETLPENTWLIGAGIIMLGSNIVRYNKGIKMVLFTNILGVVALAAGISDNMGVELPVFPILIILIGLSIVFGNLTEKNHPRH